MSRAARRRALALLFLVLAGCAPRSATTGGVFLDTGALSAELERGRSTREQVLATFGAPDGEGGCVLPPEHRSFDIWFYQDIHVGGETTTVKNSAVASVLDPGLDGALYMGIEQQWLLVFFEGETFAGYLWSSNAGKGAGSAGNAP